MASPTKSPNKKSNGGVPPAEHDAVRHEVSVQREDVLPVIAQPAVVAASEWGVVEPTQKHMGLVRLTLDKGVKTTAIGQVYGLDFEIEGDGYQVRLYFDNYNRRLKILDYEAEDHRAMIAKVRWLAQANNFDKIFLKAKREDWQVFLGLGFMLEGILKYYFRGEDAYVLSRFSTLERLQSESLIEETDLIEELLGGIKTYEPTPLPSDYQLCQASDEHIPGMVALYRNVFATYPSPLTHPDYIQQTMRRNVLYRVVLNERGEVVSAASAEMDEKHSNAEMTDCATLKSERGRSLMFHLLRSLEKDLKTRGVMTGFTLARAPSKAMNQVFYRLGYEYSGRLINNCDIYGQFEDMNIWVKKLLKAPKGAAV